MKRKIVTLTAVLAVFAAGAAIAGQGHDHDGHQHAEAALSGHCPVAYVEMNKAVEGDPHIATTFAGHHYVFANEQAKRMFEADPNKYAVAYNGYCATAAAMGKKLETDGTIFDVRDGVTYLFSSQKAKTMFEADPANVIKKADAEWVKLSPAYGGHCPVAYVEMNQPVMGDPELMLDLQGARILFANAGAKKMYEKNPKKYEVAYHGYCAAAMAMGKKYQSDPTIFAVRDGKTYLFSSEKAKKMFEAKATEVVKKADAQWASLN